MRIALVVHKFPPRSLGGTEVYTHYLAQALSRSHEVSVFYRDDGDGGAFCEGWEDRQGFRAWRVGRAFSVEKANPVALFWDTFYNRDVESSFKRFLEDFRPDVVHFQHLMLLSYRLIAQSKRLGLPCLLTLHDYWFICANSQLVWPDARPCQGKALGMNCVRCATARVRWSWLKAARAPIAPVFWLRDALIRRAALEADRLIAPSRFLIEQYVSAGFPTDRFMWLENGIDVARIQSHGRQPSADGRVRITYLGSLAWQKGVHILVEAARTLPPERVRVRVFGPLDTFPDYVDSLRKVANPAHTSLEGAVPHDLVGQVLAETDVLAVPSLWYENSPVIIQEAFAAGVPVVASRLGALAEKVTHEVSGLLVAPGDVRAWEETLRRLTDEPDLLGHLRRGIPQVMTIQDHMRRLEAIYERIVSSATFP